jgi:hypothetical protein
MRRLRQSKTDDAQESAATPAGVELAVQYGYSEAAKARGQANGGDIRRAYLVRSETLFPRDQQRSL